MPLVPAAAAWPSGSGTAFGSEAFANGRPRTGLAVTIRPAVSASNILLQNGAERQVGLAARAWARQRTFQVLAGEATEAEQAALDGLLATDPSTRRSRFARLRDALEAPAPGNMVALLDRLDWVRSIGIARDRTAQVHPARLARVVEGNTMIARHLANVEPLRRTALLVAGAADLETRLTDATPAMVCKYVGSLFTRVRGRDERRFGATGREVARTLLLFPCRPSGAG